MFRKKDQTTPLYFASCHGGKGEVVGRELLNEKDSACGFHFMHDTLVPVGGSIGRHRHHGNEEVYYLLEGEAVMVLDEERYAMYPGDVAMVKDGHTHEIINQGAAPLRLIVVEAGAPTPSEDLPHE